MQEYSSQRYARYIPASSNAKRMMLGGTSSPKTSSAVSRTGDPSPFSPGTLLVKGSFADFVALDQEGPDRGPLAVSPLIGDDLGGTMFDELSDITKDLLAQFVAAVQEDAKAAAKTEISDFQSDLRRALGNIQDCRTELSGAESSANEAREIISEIIDPYF